MGPHNSGGGALDSEEPVALGAAGSSTFEHGFGYGPLAAVRRLPHVNQIRRKLEVAHALDLVAAARWARA